ncbi:prohibitin family protein [Methanolobus bombayensis]|uniref:prohibitin family protein n=1 Tax=Methanolobus bombayensis TaxID=38023 RepID=UPI001AE6D5C5|nr:prohibitin family protein [Methanolobus bombayensis]MBP1909428.1 regulator of protease activity HflC (stomatin/prohibitin superfamily) [Methanolobus bombayensis]
MVIEDEWEPEPPKKAPEFPINEIAPIIGKVGRGIVVIFVILIIFSLMFGSIFVSVGAGEVGVKFNQFGGVENDELGEGLHIVPPWVSVTKYSVRSETYTMSGVVGEGQIEGDDQIKALTVEGLTVGLDITVRYRLLSDEVSEVHQNLGTNYAEKIIRPTIRSSIREVVSTKTALQVYGEEREVVAGEMLTNIANSLETDGIVVEEVLVRNVVLPTRVAEAIEAKLQADQDAQRMIFVKQKEQLEAERKIIEANGVANATIAEAYGEAEALRIINEQLAKNPDLINYKYIQMLQGQEIQTMLVPTDQGIILDASN